jgi:hypothetical protein
LVAASRRHLTERYAAGVDRLLWRTDQRLIPDAAVISLVADAAMAGLAGPLDLGAALVLIQVGRLRLDGLEHEIFQGPHVAGIRRDALAAILGFPDDLPDGAGDGARAGDGAGAGAGAAAQAAARASRRATRAAERAAEAARRRGQLNEPDPTGDGSRSDHAERATARAREARRLADEAAGRVSLSLVHAAAALDRYAARCAELSAGADPDTARLLGRQAQEYRRAAVSYREMAARYGKLADGSG